MNESDDKQEVASSATRDHGYDTPSILLIGGAIVVVIAQAEIGALRTSERWQGYILALIGMVLFFLGAYSFTRGRLPDMVERALSALGQVTGWSYNRLLLIGLAPLLGYAASLAAGDAPKMILPFAAVGAWLLGILVLICGAWEKPSREALRPWPIWEIAAFAALSIVAFLLRGTYLTQIPWALSGDEGSVGLTAIQFVSGARDNVFSIGWFSFPAMYFYVQAIPIEILGQTVPALRIPAAIAGVLTVAALYVFARSIFGRGIALASSAYLAAFHFHIHFSRLGLPNIWDGLFFVAFSGLLLYAWNLDHDSSRGRRFFFVMAGIVLGLAQYFYASSRSLFLVVFVWLIIALLHNRKAFLSRLPNLFAMGIATLTVVLPLALFFARHPNEFMAPMRRVTIFGKWLENELQTKSTSTLSILASQFSHSALGFTSENLRGFYQPDHSMLLAIPSALFLLGLVLVLFRLLDLRFSWLFVWLMAAVVTGALSQDPPAAQRYVFVAPVAAMLVALPIVEVGGWLARAWPKRPVIPQVALSVILVVAILGDLDFYFGDYTFNRRFGDFNTETATALGYYLADQTPGLEVYFFGAPRMGYMSLSSVPYLAPLALGHDVIQPITSPPEVTVSGPTAFIFLPERVNELDFVRQEFPNGNEVSIHGKKDALLFTSYVVK
jgi:hypothetical protein